MDNSNVLLHLANQSFILGSQSPRRKELMKLTGFEFRVINPIFEEKLLPNEDPEAYVKRNALGKAKSIWKNEKLRSNEIVICADTIVVCKGKVLEKPKSQEQAAEMLTMLQGQWHEVISGICVGKDDSQNKVSADITKVHMTALSPSTIHSYIQTGEPMDKAGSYALQGLGSCFVDTIEGSYSNVIGMSMSRLIESLKELLEE